MNLFCRGCHKDDKEIHQSRNGKYDGACDETLFGKGSEKWRISCRWTVYVNISLLTMYI